MKKLKEKQEKKKSKNNKNKQNQIYETNKRQKPLFIELRRACMRVCSHLFVSALSNFLKLSKVKRN
jgi:hypothetical protein